MKELRYGVVGVGYFGAGLARYMKELEGSKIVAVLDPENDVKIAEELGCDVEKDLDVLCSREDIDAIIVASPNYLHKEPIIAAAKNKKHIFCEKPIALTYKDCNDMVKIAKENGVIFMAGHIMNFMDGVRTVKKIINEGLIGELLYAHSERNGWEEPQETISWKKMRGKSGGHLYHHIHELDFIQFLMGPATSAYMTGGNVAHKGENFGDEDDMLFINLEFKNGTYATLHYGSAFRWSTHYVKVCGTKGAIWIDLEDVKVIVRTEKGDTRYLLHESKEVDDDRTRIYKGVKMDGAIAYGKPGKNPPLWLESIMRKEMEFFHDVVKGKQWEEEFQPLMDGTAARASIATADAATLSLKKGRKVLISEITLN